MVEAVRKQHEHRAEEEPDVQRFAHA
jgi:hypothetical protein